MYDTPCEGASPSAGCRLFQRGEIARSTRSPRQPPPRTTHPSKSASPHAATAPRRAQASVQARRDARLQSPLCLLRLAARVCARDARPRPSARQGRHTLAGQRRIGLSAVQSPQGGHAACGVLPPASVGGQQLHSLRASGAPRPQAAGAACGEPGVRGAESGVARWMRARWTAGLGMHVHPEARRRLFRRIAAEPSPSTD